jgi:hypothetical protein
LIFDFVKVYEEYPASHRDIAGEGRDILITFSDN